MNTNENIYLVVGLGNPEKEYRWTRHNTGFEVINKICFDEKIEINKSKHKAFFTEKNIYGKKVFFVKPQTYMNLSGESVIEFVNYYKIPISNIIIVYDETALSIGQIKIKEKGSAGGHNGIKNIIKILGTENFIRVRVGIGQKPPKIIMSNYVLSKFSKEEESDMVNGITKAQEAIMLILKDNCQTAMNKYNQTTKPDSTNELI